MSYAVYLGNKMKAYTLSEPGKTWKLTNLPDPIPTAGQVLVKVQATSLNYRDFLITIGSYLTPAKKEVVPLSDGAGEVIAIGEGVTQFKVGDRVAANFLQKWESGSLDLKYLNSDLGGSIDGMLAEKVVLPEKGLVKIPSHLTYEEAATLPCAALTAWNALMEQHAPLQPGSSVLTLGTGGVSVFALQFAKAAGLRVIGTSSSDEKLARLKSLGLDEGINYKTHSSWAEEVRKTTSGRGVDQVIEVAGTIKQSLLATKFGGLISVIGGLGGLKDETNSIAFLRSNVRLQPIFIGSKEMFEAMNRAIEYHKIKPVIDEVFPFDKAEEALNKLKSGQHFGKIVISIYS